MREREIVEQKKILEIVTGSHLYGTASETSDKDFVGIFMPSEEYVFGLKTIEEVDFSIKDKDESGKNTPDAVDRKFYEFRKFVRLAMANNPNILEMLFVNDENIVFVNSIGRELLAIRHAFPFQGVKEKFCGYAFSQRHKMLIKKDNYFDFLNALSYLKSQNFGKTMLEVLFSNPPSFIKENLDSQGNIDFICIGDLNFLPSVTVKTALYKIQERVDRVGNREELLTKYGYDVKFGSHLCRLLLEGIELLKTGEIKFPLKDAGILQDIKQGRWAISKVLDFSYSLEAEIQGIKSVLPSKPKYEFLEDFTVQILRKWFLL